MPAQDVEETTKLDDLETINWFTVKRKLVDLKPFEFNPRFITTDKWGELKRSLKEDGYIELIEVNLDNVIISGHQRKKALYEVFGWTDETEIDVRVPERMLNEKEFRRHLLRANKKYGEFDQDMLANYFDDQDLRDAFFTDEELGMSANLEEIDSEEDDNIPEVPKEPKTKPGDLYVLGRHRLLCGDSVVLTDVENLFDGKKANMLFTDPPYGYKYESGYQTKHKMLKNDDKILDFLPLANMFMNENSSAYLCTSHQVISEWKIIFEQNFDYKNLIVWKKNNWSMGDLKGSFAGQHELILFGHKGRVELNGERSRDVWEFDRDPPTEHPTQKPVEMISFAISKVSNEGDIVSDLFGGSGSTLIACEQKKRSCFMMELDPGYCDVIVNRYAKFMEKHGKSVSIKLNGEKYEC